MLGKKFMLKTQAGLGIKYKEVEIIKDFGGGEYVLKTTDELEMLYIRHLKLYPAEPERVGLTGISLVESLLMELTDVELERAIKFCKEQIRMMY